MADALENVAELAEDMFYRKQDGEDPYVLLLGSAATITPAVLQGIVGDDDGESFFYELNQMSHTQRRRKIEKLWEQEQLDLPNGYYALATMIKAGYFNPIITLNLDTYLDDALDEVGIKSRERQILTYGERTEAVRERGTGKLIKKDEETAEDIADALQSPPSKRVTILRLYGSLDIDEFPMYNDMFYLDPMIVDELPNALSRELVMLGDNGENDAEVTEALERTGGTVWYVNPTEPTYTYVVMPLKSRGSNEIVGEYSTFTRFFTTLEQELRKVDADAFADMRPSKPVTAPVAVDFADFEMLITAGRDDNYEIRVIESPAGQEQDTFAMPYDEDELLDVLDQLRDFDTDRDFLKEVGDKMFSALFGMRVRALYNKSEGLVDAGKGLRLRLRIEPPELNVLPWEFMYDSDRGEFLGLSKRALITRYLAVQEKEQSLVATSLPMKMLIAIASPSDLAQLDTEQEKTLIENALRPLIDELKIEVSYLIPATKRGLRQHLLDEDEDYHIIHFVGHGDFQRGEGVLAFVGRDGKRDLIYGEDLGDLLADTSVRLVVLNACKGAQQNATKAFMGVAPALVRAGLPAVVAMQFEIKDSSALAFTQDFYEMLTRYMPVDEAVSRTREALMLEAGKGAVDWGTPVLFMRARDGVIFKK